MKHSSTSLHQLLKRSQLAIFSLTFLICTAIFLVISAYTMKTYANRSLNVLSTALLERIQPAVVFNDIKTLDVILKDYAEQYPIRSIEIYDASHHLSTSIEIPATIFGTQNALDRLFFHKPVQLDIKHQQQAFGTVVIYGNSSSFVNFFHNVCLGLAFGFCIILLIHSMLVRLAYQHIIRALRPSLNQAKVISQTKNYQLRLPHSTVKEFQEVNLIVNELLTKIEASNLQLKTENDQLAHQAHHDSLTQLPNRHFFHQVLLNIFAHSAHKNNTVLLFIDNNHFKKINDQHGHLAGDAVLQEMAQRFKMQLRHDDFIARLGGDEFAVLLHHISHVDSVIKVSETLLDCCKEPLLYDGTEIYFSFSIGIAFAQFSQSPEDLIAQADHAMYQAKDLPQRWHISLQNF